MPINSFSVTGEERKRERKFSEKFNDEEKLKSMMVVGVGGCIINAVLILKPENRLMKLINFKKSTKIYNFC